MNLDKPVAELVRNIVSEWNRAERAIKIAEQILGEAPFPSIMELRYAGRRVIEAFAVVDNGGDVNATVSKLYDAYHDCFRAKHDAMDVAVNEIAGRIRFAESDLGVPAVIGCFPDFPKLVSLISNFENKIADCREERETRDATYEAILDDFISGVDENSLEGIVAPVQDSFDGIIPLYDAFKANEEFMKKLADDAIKKERKQSEQLGISLKNEKFHRNLNYALVVVGLILATLPFVL